jgi:methyl acetate hydrolase
MKTDRRTFLKASAAVLAGGAAGFARSQGSLQSNADALLQEAADASVVPGVVALATDRNGIIYEGGFGQRNNTQSNRMTPDTVVWIASMTKAITGTAAMQLVEQGKVDLDSPVARWIPEVGRTQVLAGWDADGQPQLRGPSRPLTLRHLLTHTGGWGYDLWSDDLVRYQKLKAIPGIGSCKNIALTTPLLSDPGERWVYGIGIDWAGKLVESVSGQKLGVYLKQNVFDPLGMSDTAFKITPDMRARLAKVHAHAEGKYTPIDFELPQEPEFEMGGGGLYSTASDYSKFMRVFLNKGKGNGNQVLKPQTVELMSRNAMGNLKVTMLKTAMPNLTKDAEFFPGMPKNWGLSFMINEEMTPSGRTPGSLAWAGLANTYFWIDQSKGIGGVYMTQVLPFVDEQALPLFFAFEKQVYQSLA